MRKPVPRSKILRLLDANYNRAKEGLRVCEDVCRFVLDSRPFSRGFRNARHELLKILLSLPFPYDKIVASRDVQGDSGKAARSNKSPTGVKDVFLKNVKRAEEAIRVLEEFTGLISLFSSGRFQRLRFKIYALEKKALRRF